MTNIFTQFLTGSNPAYRAKELRTGETKHPWVQRAAHSSSCSSCCSTTLQTEQPKLDKYVYVQITKYLSIAGYFNCSAGRGMGSDSDRGKSRGFQVGFGVGGGMGVGVGVGVGV